MDRAATAEKIAAIFGHLAEAAAHPKWKGCGFLRTSAELAILRALAKELEARIPIDPLKKLNDDLDKAVREERYEDAASLRDRIRRLGDPEPPAPE